MTGRRGRKVHVVTVDGVSRNAYSTSIDYSLTLDDLVHAIAVAATTLVPTERRFRGALSHNTVAGESFWSERDNDDAASVAASIGPGLVYAAARAGLQAHGESWRLETWPDYFPPEAARRRAEQLFPMLADRGNPFAPGPNAHDR